MQSLTTEAEHGAASLTNDVPGDTVVCSIGSNGQEDIIPGGDEQEEATQSHRGGEKNFRDVHGINEEEPGIQGRGAAKIWWYPWPRPGQKVMLWDEVPVDPFTRRTIPWWIPNWVLFGGDPANLKPMPDEQFQSLRAKYHWPERPFPPEKGIQLACEHYLTQQAIIQDREVSFFGNKCRCARLNLQTFADFFGLMRLLRRSRRYRPFLFHLLVPWVILIVPVVSAVLIVGVIPLGDIRGMCDFSEQTVFVFVYNPWIQIARAFSMLHLGFASMDPNMPWRPFRTYWFILLAVYVAQVIVFAPVFARARSFPMLGLVANAVTLLVVVVNLHLLRNYLSKYDTGASATHVSIENLREVYMEAVSALYSREVSRGVDDGGADGVAVGDSADQGDRTMSYSLDRDESDTTSKVEDKKRSEQIIVTLATEGVSKTFASLFLRQGHESSELTMTEARRRVSCANEIEVTMDSTLQREKAEAAVAAKRDRLANYMKVLGLQFFFTAMLYLFSGYLFTAGDGTAASIVSFLFFIPQLIYRKGVQSITSQPGKVFYSDMTFILAGFWVYSSVALWGAFNATNDTEGEDDLSLFYVGMYFSTVLSSVTEVFELSELWMRFRCWVKTWGINVIKKLRCSPRGDVDDAEMMPFDAEMDIDGRGRSNARPDYLRTKVRFSFVEFMAVQASYATYLILCPILRYGPNNEYFPYSKDECQAPLHYKLGGFDDEQFYSSLVFSAVCYVSMAALVLIYTEYTRRYYPLLEPWTKALTEVLSDRSANLGFYMLAFSCNVFDCLIMANAKYRVWFASFGDGGGWLLGKDIECPLEVDWTKPDWCQ